jgi:hypothetical protein
MAACAEDGGSAATANVCHSVSTVVHTVITSRLQFMVGLIPQLMVGLSRCRTEKS